ncbi:MAG TPA: tetratricopeptide repeat protein, partial [Polyangiaceae bacterium]|nr:tetratricopeptide repeat protein [Polyangiaceae bacterium]
MALALAAPLAMALVGCARTAEERQLDDMRAEIDRLQVSRDKADQVALPAAAPDGAELRMPPTPLPEPTAQPAEQDAVTLGSSTPEPADDYADTEDTTPRPSIRVLGAGRAALAGGRGWHGDDQVEQSPVDDSADPTRPGHLDPAAAPAYDAAMQLVNAHQYDRALDALAAFLVRWPDHPYADNAMYWRGECYFAKGDYRRAADQFEGTVARFPAGAKAPDALLKLGMSEQKLGDPA